MTEHLRISLLGLGRAGNFHLQSLQLLDSATVECVYDVDSARADSIGQKHGCRVARDMDEAISPASVDAIIVATPTDSHFEFVMAGLNTGKPVLTEKPLGRHLSQIDDCFAAATKNSAPLFVAFQRRFDPSFASLIDGVHSGRIGELQFIRSVSRDNPVPSMDYISISGGIFHDCIVHDLDMVCTIAAATPVRMSSFGSSFISGIGKLDDFDSVVASLAFENGITASIDVNRQSAYGYDQRIEAFGADGMLQAENRHQTTIVHGGSEGFMKPPVDYSFPTRYRDAYLAELACFVECARGDRDVPITHEDVRNNHLLASGLEIAAREQRVVEFSEIESHPTVAHGESP